jgi:hypothetical protein
MCGLSQDAFGSCQIASVGVSGVEPSASVARYFHSDTSFFVVCSFVYVHLRRKLAGRDRTVICLSA